MTIVHSNPIEVKGITIILFWYFMVCCGKTTLLVGAKTIQIAIEIVTVQGQHESFGLFEHNYFLSFEQVVHTLKQSFQLQ
jgi:hypothetical protein